MIRFNFGVEYSVQWWCSGVNGQTNFYKTKYQRQRELEVKSTDFQAHLRIDQRREPSARATSRKRSDDKY